MSKFVSQTGESHYFSDLYCTFDTVRAVTTIEADESAASSDFLKKTERERERERKRAKDKISISALLKGIFGM